MWTRIELKAKAREALRVNFWKTVLISLVLSIVAGSGGGFSGSVSGSVSGVSSGISSALANMGYTSHAAVRGDVSSAFPVAAVIAIVIIFFFIFMILMALLIALDILLFNPTQIGCARFSLINLNRRANVSEVGFGFDNSYKNMVKVMFFRDLLTFLWTLLFIIPGIVKSYEYRMIPYLLADHPEMSMEEAFATSRSLMTGQKWKAFVLDLSFLGWDILSLFTAGILSLFYVSPYKMMTNAALYEALAYGTPAIPETPMPEENPQYAAPTAPPSEF